MNFNGDSSSSTSDPQPAIQARKRKAGRKKFRETRHPIYRGVRERKGGRWVCEVGEPHKKSRLWLGTYPTPEMAARAYDVAALALRGGETALNFPDSARVLPQAKSSSAADIHVAAVAAAEAFPLPLASVVEIHHDTQCVDKLGEVSPVFFDEEAMFDMPGLLSNMAEGMLLAPPAFANGCNWDEVDCNIDLSLWTD